MAKLSSSTIKTIKHISSKSNDDNLCKMCEHLLSSTDDVENAMNTLIEDTAFYKPFLSSELGEIFVALSKDVTEKIIYKRPKR